jgi:nicotinate-nucleotide--dimethylbenzimidazole phosphoribosyltransferase
MLALAAATSSPALAESGVPDMSIATLPDLAEATTAVLEEAGVPELDPMAAVDPANALPAVPAQTTAAEPVTAGAVAAPPPEPAVEEPAEAVPAVNPTPDAPPAPAATQTAPTNVNVSVRVDSPGDNGAVEQANVAVVSGDAGSGTDTEPQYQPDAPQYQESIPAPAAPAADPAPEPPTAEPAPPADGWEWNWDWNCGDGIPEIPIPPEVATQNWTWNWDWNCGDADSLPANTIGESTPQYQPGVAQYRPININISIRINSPGNDGPVNQTNVAVVVIAPPLPQLRVELPAAPSAQAASGSVSSEAAAPLGFLTAAFGEVFADSAAELFEEDDRHEPSGAATAAAAPQSVLLPQAPPAIRPDTPARERFHASVAVTIRLAKASEAAARVARPVPKPAQLRPAPRRSAAPTREQAAALSAAGFAPLNAPDGRLGTFLALAVAFAFAVAFAQASRSVAAEVRAAGEDPDPPPDRPG